MAISLQKPGDPIHFMFGSKCCFRGQRIERRYFRFEQIQDGDRRHLGKISNGNMFAAGRPIHFMFGYRVGFSGTADLMTHQLRIRWSNSATVTYLPICDAQPELFGVPQGSVRCGVLGPLLYMFYARSR